MRKSKTETAETRSRIIATASKMFLEAGLGAVGMRDIMAAAGLTRGAFYRHFASKDQLIAEANGASSERLYLTLQSRVAGKSKAKALETIASVYLSQGEDREHAYPCTLAMIGAELSHYDENVRDGAIDAYRHMTQLVADHLSQRTRLERLNLASALMSMMVGAVTLANIAPDRVTAKSILTNAKAMVLKAAKP